MDTLDKLFGGETKVKLFRLFLLNADIDYTFKELVSRTQAEPAEIKKLLNNVFLPLGLVKKGPTVREIPLKSKKIPLVKKVNDVGYALDQRFPYLHALKTLIITVTLKADQSLLKRFANVGKVKLFMASGVFLQEWDTRVDLLIVGDELNHPKLEKIISTLESEVGKEITYSIFTVEEFEYRLGIHDRLIRDIFDSPHSTLIDKLGIEPPPSVQ